MKNFLALLLLLISNLIFSQKDDTESLVNSFTKDFVPKDFEYYNLLDESFSINFDVDYLNEAIESYGLEKEISFKKQDFIISKSKINWNEFTLKKAKVYSDDKIPKFKSSFYEYILVDKKMSQKKLDSIIDNKKYSQIVVKVNPNWSEERKIKQSHKELKNQESRIKKENRDFYSISSPIFSSDKKFAIISFRDCCHTVGYLYFYSNKNWHQYLEFYRIVSN